MTITFFVPGEERDGTHEPGTAAPDQLAPMAGCAVGIERVQVANLGFEREHAKLQDLAFIEAMERAVIDSNRHEAAQFLDDAIVYTVGALQPVTGIDAVISYVAAQSRFARWDGHTLQGSWTIADGLIVEVQSHFTRQSDGTRLTLPCVDIYRFKAGRIADWRVYADLSIFAGVHRPA